MSIETLTDTILSKMSDVCKWQRPRRLGVATLVSVGPEFSGQVQFFKHARQGCYNELTYRQNFARSFNWLAFKIELIMAYTFAERIIVFDPCHVNKSGKCTPGVGWHWSGCAGAPEWRLEIGSFSAVDIVNHTALHLVADQTLASNVSIPGSAGQKSSSCTTTTASENSKVSKCTLQPSRPYRVQICGCITRPAFNRSSYSGMPNSTPVWNIAKADRKRPWTTTLIPPYQQSRWPRFSIGSIYPLNKEALSQWLTSKPNISMNKCSVDFFQRMGSIHRKQKIIQPINHYMNSAKSPLESLLSIVRSITAKNCPFHTKNQRNPSCLTNKKKKTRRFRASVSESSTVLEV